MAARDGTTTNTTIITVRAGVMIDDPPVAEYNETTGLYYGFYLDILDYVVELAESEGYTLNLELESVSQSLIQILT